MPSDGMTEVADITRELLHRVHEITPEYLFMAMYTADAHLRELEAQ